MKKVWTWLQLVIVLLHPISWFCYYNIDRKICASCNNMNCNSLLVFHEDKVKDTVEECVDEIRKTEVEDEQVCDCSHFWLIWSRRKLWNVSCLCEYLLITIQRTIQFPMIAMLIMRVKTKFQKKTRYIDMGSWSMWEVQGTIALCSCCLLLIATWLSSVLPTQSGSREILKQMMVVFRRKGPRSFAWGSPIWKTEVGSISCQGDQEIRCYWPVSVSQEISIGLIHFLLWVMGHRQTLELNCQISWIVWSRHGILITFLESWQSKSPMVKLPFQFDCKRNSYARLGASIPCLVSLSLK